MKFGEIPLDDAEGAILAHSLRLKKIAYKKGRVLTADDIAALRAAGVERLVAARLGKDDVAEDAAAARVAEAIRGDGLQATAPFTGRVNLIAEAHGVAVIDPGLEALNRLDEAVTLATLPRWERVAPKQIVATVKVIPFAAPAAVVKECERRAAAAGGGLIRVAPLQEKRIGLIQTFLPGTKASILDKSDEVMHGRLHALGSALSEKKRCPHETAALAETIRAFAEQAGPGLPGPGKPVDILLIAGASAITDRRDIIPAAITENGGTITHYGMPVDPGNLLMIGEIAGLPVVGLPGCARSPKFNGVDWVLQRLCADLPLTPADIMAMGIGGLLKEMPGRPQPRTAGRTQSEAPRAPRIAALILAAGQSRRMGRRNKLLQPVEGKPMVRWAVEAALASQADPVLVVLGHQTDAVRRALADDSLIYVDNPDFADGISASLRRGVAAVGDDFDAVIVCLGDMPRIGATQIDRLIAAFNPVEGREICIPTWLGKRGNPVLIGRRFFAEIQEISGDVGARHLIGQYPESTCDVEMGDDAVLIDIDTPQALDALSA